MKERVSRLLDKEERGESAVQVGVGGMQFTKKQKCFFLGIGKPKEEKKM